MYFINRPLFMSPDGWIEGTINPNNTVNYPDGTVLSVQPNGTYEARPNGTAGPYELFVQSGDKLRYSGTGNTYVIQTVD